MRSTWSPWRSEGATLVEVLAALGLSSLLLLLLLSALGLVQAADFRARTSPVPNLQEKGEMHRGWEAAGSEVRRSRAAEETGDPACPLRLFQGGGWGRLCLDAPYFPDPCSDPGRLVFRPEAGGEREVYRPPCVAHGSRLALAGFGAEATAPGLFRLLLTFRLDRPGGGISETVYGSVYVGD